MKITPKILKAVAEAIYDNDVQIDDDIVYINFRHPDNTWHWKLWEPHKDAEQCLKVLEWFDFEIKRIVMHGEKYWMIWTEGVGDFVSDNDCKSAVVLAAHEYILNQE